MTKDEEYQIDALLEEAKTEVSKKAADEDWDPDELRGKHESLESAVEDSEDYERFRHLVSLILDDIF